MATNAAASATAAGPASTSQTGVGGRVGNGPAIYHMDVPQVPDVGLLAGAVQTPDGIVAMLRDMYSHLNQQGVDFSNHVGLSQHSHQPE